MCRHMAAEELANVEERLAAYDDRPRNALRSLLAELPEGERDDAMVKVEAAEAVAEHGSGRGTGEH